MSTSGTTAFSLTAREIITSALYEAGVISLGVDPKAKELSECIRRTNMMFRTWQIDGLVWKDETISLSGTADTATITLPARVRSVSGVRHVDGATNERALSRFERDDYRILPNKAASGTPSIFHLDRQRDALVLYVWPVPVASFTLKADIGSSIETITDAAQTLDIPEEWHEAVMMNVAARCAGLFGVSNPELTAKAAVLERKMMDQSRPASYFLGPA